LDSFITEKNWVVWMIIVLIEALEFSTLHY
jgi:hypothetical protein